MRKKEFMQLAEEYFNAELRHSHACMNNGLSTQMVEMTKAKVAKEKLLKAIKNASENMCMP